MSSDLEDLGLSIKKVQWRHHRELDSQLMRLGISLVQWNALREIHRNPGKSAHALAELTFNSDQAFGTLTTRLMRQGYVDRQPGAGRANTHHLTESGKSMLSKGQKIMDKVLTKSFYALSSQDRMKLAQLLTKLLNSSQSNAELPRLT